MLYNELVFNVTFNLVDKDKDGALDHDEAKALMDQFIVAAKKAAAAAKKVKEKAKDHKEKKEAE